MYDLLNLFTVGLYSHTTDIYSFPLNNAFLVEDTATLVVYSGNTIMSLQIEHNLAPQQAVSSALPNRVQKIKGQSWVFDASQNTIYNNLRTDSTNYQLNIKYFYIIDGSLFVLYKNQIVEINSSLQILQQQQQEIDKAIQLPNIILTTTYLGNIVLYNTFNLTQINKTIQLGVRVKQLTMLLQFQEVMILAYNNTIYRLNFISYNLIKWFSPTSDQIYKIYYDDVNKITFITMKSSNCYIFDGINIQLSVPPNPISNSFQIPYTSSQIFQISIEPITGIFAVYTIPDNNLSKIDFYQYNFTNKNTQQLQNITYLGFIPQFSRSPGLKIQFIASNIFIFSSYQLIIYNNNLTLQNMIRSTSIFSSLKKIIVINSPQNDTNLFFAQQESNISLFSYKSNNLIQLYSHSCITPNLVDYQLSQLVSGFQVSILVLCDDKVINDSFYLENLTQSLSQIQQCYTVSQTQYQYQMLQNLDKSFYEESSNPALIRIEQLQQTDFGSYNSTRNLNQSVFYLNQTSSVTVQQTQFKYLKCLNCNGGALQINQGENHLIQNCDFQQIESQNGGALAILECPTCNITITNSIFKSNVAKIYGGAIYLQNSNVQIAHTIIQQNNAQIGGGIKYTKIKPILNNNLTHRNLEQQNQNNNVTLVSFYRQIQQSQSSNIISDNKAKIYGNNIGSYLQDVVICQPVLKTLSVESDQQISNLYGINRLFILQSYEINNFRSGNSIDLKIQLLDEENNPIKFNPNFINKKKYDNEILSELQNLQVKIEPQNNTQLKVFGKYTADYSQFDEASSSFIIKGLIIVSNPLTTNIIKISSSSLTKIDAQTRQVDEESLNNLFSLVLINTRNCTYGEVYQLVDVIYQCFICQEGSYFLSLPTIQNTACLKCPEYSQSCRKNEIQLKSGYWRLNNLTDNIISCSRNPRNCVPIEEKNYCIKGYYGPLCEQCDVYGILWDQPYISDGNYNCYPCADLIHKPYYSYLSLNLILMLLFIISSIVLQLSLTKSLTVSYYLRKMHMISIIKSAFFNSSSLGLKIFIGYLQVSGIIYSQLEFSFPYGTRLLSNTIGMPVTNLFYSLDFLVIYGRHSVFTFQYDVVQVN
ncbi:transmembrane protein, putative (macronuclear) [Tetrahymena thermophila SB210]|uniref:Transmembrane protein, putative n=1 Tax=Tetrahymena thermophila (strain SB210) TaxID=312017 RepID=Q23WT4_TETTS|nr:transmembrane protein, putative [Tetrahymena thermophila SB210]EAS01011.2 transmembrane protein, putative [Tetrahymena thermophila SB210]|eukprot:XP_001021256.2 transmembrane protein, putative [Tetrahymena thermophila SB210]